MRALDAALQTGIGIGIGIEDAYKALKALDLDANALATIDAEVHIAEDAYAACTRNSFPGITQVLMADGSHKPISAVRTGDILLATAPDTGALRPEPVTAAFAHSTQRLVDITLADGGTLTSTAGHRVYVAQRGWTYTSDLHTGDQLRASDGTLHPVSGLRDRAGIAPQKVYDLTVDDLHTFYVRTAGGRPQDLLVHNCLDIVADEGDKYGAHTLKDHVLSDSDTQARADKTGRATNWKDQDTAVRAIGKAYQQWIAKPANRTRMENWMGTQAKRGAFDPTVDLLPIEWQVRDEGQLGKVFTKGGASDGSDGIPTGNTVRIFLKYVGKSHKPEKFVVYTSYPE
ncbi:polymorphic toxin-type HINT domain-containing protein [Kitasatospora sp. GP82]|uniref:polymorphic toxin-type HINT domain-containing protein n=1 Tax=Kitasatospora sp. GP82 TaxID=3035089 RepID=UPI00247427C3|nr:polymorphic toxin-type HINT domain-containing protein [Kitasatospora sp. GP82]